MSNIGTIIAGVALDGQDEPVAARAGQLAAQHEARLILAHVIEKMAPVDFTTDGVLDAETMKGMLERDAAEQLDATTNGMNADIRYQGVVAEGKPAEAIMALLRREKADLVVLGPGRPQSLREKVFGSTADHIVRSAPVPVLIVRRRGAEPYRRVVVAADLSAQSLSASLAARSLAPEAAIEHVHAVEMPLSVEQALLRAGTSGAEIDAYRRARLIGAREQLKAAFANDSTILRLRVLPGDARATLVRQARSRRTDLVALGAHGRSVPAQMLLGSVARNVLHAATCDVLMVSH